MKEKTEDIIEVQESKPVDDEKKWCVYMHTSPSGKRYIGITSKKPEHRWQNGNGYCRQPYFWKAIQKYKWDNFTHEILVDNLCMNEAYEMEKYFIGHFNSNNPQYGYNNTDGGEGKCGYHPSEESKLKNSLSHIGLQCGDKNGMYGKNHSDESKKKMSINKKGQNMGLLNIRINPVYSVNFDQLFLGPTYVEKEYGINFTGIVHCCKGDYKSAGKHPVTGEPLRWKYVYDQTLNNGRTIDGAITLGYITEQRVNEYLNNLQQKGNDTL